ncbi:hypothetical protein GCM10027053_48730 [Intrasporangium mesophilum]
MPDVTGDASAMDPPPHDERTQRPVTGAGRFDRWRAGWRVSLRMARREVRRHRGRSLLIVVMVGLPVLLLTAGSTLWFSEDLDAAERLPLQLGQAQGYLVDPQPLQLRQLTDPRTSYADGSQQPPPARPVPGYAPGREGAALQALVGGHLHEVTVTSGAVRAGRHWTAYSLLGIDPRSARSLFSPKVSLTSGRWPASPDEVVVTSLGVAAGLPLNGTLELHATDTPGQPLPPRSVTVVGVGTAFDTWGADEVHPVELVGLPETGTVTRQWLVDRDTPITWSEVQRLNTYGIGAFSRWVVEHPDSVVLPVSAEPRPGDAGKLYTVAGASVGLLLLTSLLAGPAFAVSAARQRRTLALAASNGATRSQLRRTVLAQALVLGVLSAVVGAALGLAGGLAAGRITHRLNPAHFYGPPDISWSSVLIVVAAGVVSSVVAALIPSRGLGRLDIVSILKGQHVSPPLRTHVPVIGAVLVAIGVAMMLFASYRSENLYFLVFVGGGLVLVIGALLLVPLILAIGARLANHLPLPPRMAAREAGRLRGRATPTVAAIMGGAAVLTTVCIGLQADTERGAHLYRPQVAEGQAVIYGGSTNPSGADIASVVRSVDPGLHVLTRQHAGDSASGADVRLAAVRPGCSFDQSVPEIAYANGITISNGTLPPCATASTEGFMNGMDIVIGDLDELDGFLGLDADQRSALAGGGVGLLDPDVLAALPASETHGLAAHDLADERPVPVTVTGGSARFYRYLVRHDVSGMPVVRSAERSQIRMAVVPFTRNQWLRITTANGGSPAALLTSDTAKRLGMTTRDDDTLVRVDGAITDRQQAALTDAVLTRFPQSSVTVERGYERDDALIVGAMIGVIALVILVATLIATALGQAESAPLLGTLAGVGATRRTRRAMAASQAVYLSLVGAVVGVALGLAPGIAISRILTATYTDNGMELSTVIISIPWVQVLLPLVAVPVVAGTLAWVSIRRAPVVTRRTT